MLITDCHIHIQPIELFKPQALALMKKSRKDFDQIAEYCASPKAFLKYLDRIGIEDVSRKFFSAKLSVLVLAKHGDGRKFVSLLHRNVFPVKFQPF